MKKKIAITLIVALVTLIPTTMLSACAKQPDAAQEVQTAPVPVETSVRIDEKNDVNEEKDAVQPDATQEAQTAPAPVETSVRINEKNDANEEKDAIVGAFKYPPNPYGDEFDSFIVFNEDGSFLYATNLYENGRSGAFTQQTRTNEDFYWLKTGRNSYELHEDYHDINGEFVTPITYDAETDAIYMYGTLYASRDNTFAML